MSSSSSENISDNEVEIIRVEYDSLCGYDLGEKLGSGVYGRIYNITKDDTEYAIKIYRNNVKEDGANIEGDILTRLNHPYILHSSEMLTKIDDENIKNVAYLLPCAGKSLKDSMDNFLFDQKIEILYKIAQGMKYLHNNNIIHLDIKLDNIVMQDNDPIIVDFGTSRYCHYNVQTAGFQCTTSNYALPSNLFDNDGSYKYNRYNDVYSFMVLAYFFIGERELFEYETTCILKDTKSAFKYLLYQLPEITENKNFEEVIKPYINFFFKCSKSTTTFDDIVNDPIFNKFRSSENKSLLEGSETFVKLFINSSAKSINAESLFSTAIKYVTKYIGDTPVSFLFLIVELLHRVINTFGYDENIRDDYFFVAYYIATQCYGIDLAEDEYPCDDFLVEFVHKNSAIVLCNYFYRGLDKKQYEALWRNIIVPSFKDSSIYVNYKYEEGKKSIPDKETCEQFLKRMSK